MPLAEGAIGRAVFQRSTAQSGLRIGHVVVRPAQLSAVQAQLGGAALACVAVPADAQLVLRGKPLAENPKTSMLTVLCALRFLHNRVAALTL